MKRSILMFVLLLTVIASVAGAATVTPSASPLPALLATPAAPSACDTSKTQPGLPPFMAASKATTCGSCSDTQCQGAQLHSACFKLGSSASYTCQNAFGNFCSGIIPQCQCWTGPLP